MTQQDELMRDLARKLQGNRKPTLFGAFIAALCIIAFKAWLLMLLLGIVAIGLHVPALAFGYWLSTTVWCMLILICPTRKR